MVVQQQHRPKGGRYIHMVRVLMPVIPGMGCELVTGSGGDIYLAAHTFGSLRTSFGIKLLPLIILLHDTHFAFYRFSETRQFSDG